MPHKPPTTVTWIRLLLLLLSLASLYQPVAWSFLLPPDWFSVLLVAVLALPALPPLLLAALGRRGGKFVFSGILLTCVGFLVVPVFISDPYPQTHHTLQLLSSAAALILVLLPGARSFYTSPRVTPGRAEPWPGKGKAHRRGVRG